MDPLVSVIVPIYNVEPWVRKCLDAEEVLMNSGWKMKDLRLQTRVKLILWHMNENLFRTVYQSSRKRMMSNSYKG